MRWLRTLLLIAFTATSTVASAEMTRRWDRWEPNWEFDGVMAQFRGGVSGALWYPLLQDQNTICFSQAGVGWVRNAYFADFGLGFRRFITCDVIAGANAFIDVSYSDHDISYYQGGLGAELLGPVWELHVNGYLPKLQMTRISQKIIPGTRLAPNPNGGSFIFSNDIRRQVLECSYFGYDAEAGYMFDVGPGEMWAWVGYAYYQTQHRLSYQGPRFLVEYVSKPMIGWGGQVFAGVGWEHNRLHGGQTGARVGFRVPFCWYSSTRIWNKSSLCRRAAYAVRRQPGVRIERETRDRSTIPILLGNIFFAQQGGVGTGTQANPTNLVAALGLLAPNDVLFLLNTGGNILLPAGGINLAGTNLNNVVVAGFGSDGFQASFPVRTGRPLTVTALAGQQGRPILTGGAIPVTLADGNRLQGFGVTATPQTLAGAGRAGAIITDITSNAIAANGMVFANMTGNVSVTNSTFTGVTGNAIQVGVTTGNLNTTTRIENNLFLGSTGDALDVAITAVGTNQNLVFSNNTVTQTGQHVVDFNVTSGAAGPTTINAIMNNNTTSGVANESYNIQATFANATDTFNLQLDDNTIVSPAGAIQAVTLSHFNNGSFNAIVTNNRESNNATATNAFSIGRAGAGNGILCTRFTGNSTGRPAGVILDGTPITTQVEQLTQLRALNNNMTVALVGTVADVPEGSCPSPTIP